MPQAAPAHTTYAPNRQLNLWPYSERHDPRLHLHNQYILINGWARIPQLKIGYRNHVGWAAYQRHDVLFCKRFEPLLEARYPDHNSNVEVFCHEQFLELETLALLQLLEPGQSTTHVERWDWYRVAPRTPTMDNIAALIQQLAVTSLERVAIGQAAPSRGK